MYVRVAIQAPSANHPCRVRSASNGLVPALKVAALAETRNLRNQHAGVDGTMGIVAYQAILANRTMLPQERPALFRVALIAFVVYRIRADQMIPLRTMWVVAIGAGDLALLNRMA